MAERERAVVVLDHEPLARAVGERLEPGLEAVQGGREPARGAPDVQHAHGLRAELHGVEEGRLQLDVARRGGADRRVLGVEDDVLARVGGEPDVRGAGRGAERRELVAALVHLAVELRQVGVGRVGRERRRHPVHADAVARAVVDDGVQRLERPAQVRAGLPAARVVARQAALAEHLDGEAQAHAGGTARPGGRTRSAARRPRRASPSPAAVARLRLRRGRARRRHAGRLGGVVEPRARAPRDPAALAAGRGDDAGLGVPRAVRVQRRRAPSGGSPDGRLVLRPRSCPRSGARRRSAPGRGTVAFSASSASACSWPSDSPSPASASGRSASSAGSPSVGARRSRSCVPPMAAASAAAASSSAASSIAGRSRLAGVRDRAPGSASRCWPTGPGAS